MSDPRSRPGTIPKLGTTSPTRRLRPIGASLALPVLPLTGGALFVPRLRGFGWWAGLTCLLYVTQVVLAAGANPLPLSLHPLNGALLLSASLILLAKVERRRAQPVREGAPT